MCKALTILATGILAGLIGCGGSDSPPGGGGGSMANPTGGSMVPPGCNLPPCMANLVQDCVPSGTCVEQTSGLFNTNSCYSNGVKQIIKTNVNLATGSGDLSFTYKKNNAVCYSFSGALPLTAVMPSNYSFNMKNAAGATVATLSVDSATDKATVTCTGGQAVVLNDKCDSSVVPDSSSLSGDTDDCTQGTCTP